MHLRASSTTNLALTAQIHYKIPFRPRSVARALPPSPNLTFLARLGYFCGSLERPRATTRGNWGNGDGTFEGKEQIRNVLFISFPSAAVSALSVKRGGMGNVPFRKNAHHITPARRQRERDGGGRFPSDPRRKATLLLLLFAIATLHRDYRLIASLRRCLSPSVGFLKLYSNGSVPAQPRSAPPELFSVW